MRQYNDFTDEELVIRARDGEEEITEYLMDKYKNLVILVPSMEAQTNHRPSFFSSSMVFAIFVTFRQ